MNLAIRQYPKTALAALLTLVVVVAPCTAWWIAGQRALRQDVRELISAPQADARAEGARLATLLADRLESLRQSESHRPYYDYLPEGELTFVTCETPGHLASSLSNGPADPLIWSHFQVDPFGQLTLPAMGRAEPLTAEQRMVLEELECAASLHLAQLRSSAPMSEQTMIQTPDGTVQVGPFQWHTISIANQPSRVALREVRTQDAILNQGFVVLQESMESLFAGSTFPARTLSGESTNENEILIPLAGAPWIVEVDPELAVVAAQERGEETRRSFYLLFTLGALGALGIGALLVSIVWQAERLAQRRVQFAASAAHELRTPLAGIQLHAEMLAHASGNPEKTDLYAQRIAGEADRLGRVVTNVLGFARLQRDGLGVRAAPGDLAQAVDQVLDRVRPTLESKGVRLEADIDFNLPHAVFDRDAVDQMLLNLLDNAEKYSREANNRTVRVELSCPNGIPTLAVIDFGHGVEPNVRRRLFEPFVRTTHCDAPAGLGIGLALVKALAEQQRAHVQHDDLEGRRTRFSVTFQPAT